MNQSVLELMHQHKSIRKYNSQTPTDEIIKTIVQAGQRAPFASQLYSVLLSRRREQNPFKAPLLFTLCIDSHKLELIMTQRGWQLQTNDLFLLLLGIQDTALMTQNMILAAQSLGLGSCLLGATPYKADKIVTEYQLPPRVFPLVQLAVGYPDESPDPRPRYPLSYTLFEDSYPIFSQDDIQHAMDQMDTGYLAQDYYRARNVKIPLQGDRTDNFTFRTYSWTEHISRKWGQWMPGSQGLETLFKQFIKCGFQLQVEEEI